LAKALIYLLENEGTAKKMGNYGKQRVQDYSWGKIADKTEEVYKNLYSD
jgi:glycosyltransferase involved in cell wall biosynthesis